MVLVKRRLSNVPTTVGWTSSVTRIGLVCIGPNMPDQTPIDIDFLVIYSHIVLYPTKKGIKRTIPTTCLTPAFD